MVEIQPAPEGSVSSVAATFSPQGVDRARQRRRRALWGAVGVIVVLALLLGAGGWLWWTRPSTTSVPLPAGVGRGSVMSLDGSIPAPETKAGRLETGGMRSERHQWIGSVYWTPREGNRLSMRCTWVRASISTAWAPSPSSPSTHRPSFPTTRMVGGRREFTLHSTPDCTGVNPGTPAEPAKTAGRHCTHLIEGRFCPPLCLLRAHLQERIRSWSRCSPPLRGPWAPPRRPPLKVLTGRGSEGGVFSGAPSESLSYSRSCWGWGVGCGGFVRAWQALRSRPPARLRRSRAPPFRPVLRKVT